ncbi:Histidine phosphatase [Fragilaria crotonensis]|nr:Histidine phosphatase [Fragilaria crotonensis]
MSNNDMTKVSTPVTSLALKAQTQDNKDDCDGTGLAMALAPTTDTTTTTTTKNMNLLLIRHGRSLGNDMMDQPGNRWGDPHFKDDATLCDAPLSERGIQQAMTLGQSIPQHEIETLELIVVSPLTRALQTMQYSIFDKVPSHIPILVHPLLTERVYTLSDTGRRVEELKADFPDPRINFDLLLQDDCHDKWWFHMDSDATTTTGTTTTTRTTQQYKEWRPCDAHQWYATPGEPHSVFEARLEKLQHWLASRSEQNICFVTHWAVLQHLTDGDNFENCEAKWISWERRKEYHHFHHGVTTTSDGDEEDGDVEQQHW